MPSMVPIDLPLASTPSIRQEQTSRPSTMTLQAPQSPVEQPSLVPVRPSWSRRHIEQRLLRLAQELDGIAVDRCCYVVFRHQPFLARSSAICGRAARQHARDLDADIRWCRACRRSAGRPRCAAAASFCSAASSTVLPTRASAAAGAPAAAARPPRPARRGPPCTMPAASSVRHTPRAHHRDIHLGARNEAQIGVARARRLWRQQERGDDLALGQGELARGRASRPRPAGRAGPWARRWSPSAPAAIRAGTLSAAGEPLQRLPPMVARPWTWVEPIRLAASTTPGHTCLSCGCSFSSAPVTAAPMRKPPSSSLIWRSLGDPLDVDDQLGLEDVGAHLHQEVGAAGQHARLARFPRPAAPPPGRAIRRLVSHLAFLLTGCARLQDGTATSLRQLQSRQARAAGGGERRSLVACKPCSIGQAAAWHAAVLQGGLDMIGSGRDEPDLFQDRAELPVC